MFRMHPIRECYKTEEEYRQAERDFKKTCDHEDAMHMAPVLIFLVGVFILCCKSFGYLNVSMVVGGYCVLHYAAYKIIRWFL